MLSSMAMRKVMQQIKATLMRTTGSPGTDLILNRVYVNWNLDIWDKCFLLPSFAP